MYKYNSASVCLLASYFPIVSLCCVYERTIFFFLCVVLAYMQLICDESKLTNGICSDYSFCVSSMIYLHYKCFMFCPFFRCFYFEEGCQHHASSRLSAYSRIQLLFLLSIHDLESVNPKVCSNVVYSIVETFLCGRIMEYQGFCHYFREPGNMIFRQMAGHQPVGLRRDLSW